MLTGGASLFGLITRLLRFLCGVAARREERLAFGGVAALDLASSFDLGVELCAKQGGLCY